MDSSLLTVSPFSSLPTKISPLRFPRRSDTRHLPYTFLKRMNAPTTCIWAITNRKRRIEAINGVWAMIGLTAGLVIEGETGKSILSQLAGHLDAIFSFFTR